MLSMQRAEYGALLRRHGWRAVQYEENHARRGRRESRYEGRRGMVPKRGQAGLCKVAEPYRHALCARRRRGANDAEALFWLTLAARQGHWTAKVNDDALAAKLSKEVVTAVKQRADNWKPR